MTATTTELLDRHPASYRDPDSTVFVGGGRVLRGLAEPAAVRYAALESSRLLQALVSEGFLVGTRDADRAQYPALARYARVLEHDPIGFVSLPSEWPFALLRRAALLHLDVHLRALEHGMTLVDASAYNVQFRGVRPVFIDVGSFRPYRDGELWAGHRQFCEQFLNPLLLDAELGVAHHAWLRGSPEGVSTRELARLLPSWRWLSPRHLFHVLLPARAERHVARREEASVERIRRARLPVEGYRALLGQLRNWIAGLTAARLVAGSVWGDYSHTRTYDTGELAAKRAIVDAFARAVRPRMMWDLGCNDGEFSAVALAAGAGSVVGFDADVGALEKACERAERGGLELLPLYMDAANPGTGQGWRGREHAGLAERPGPDAVMALAFAHHLALGRNVPIEEVVDFITGLAPRGLVEFVPKSDPTAQRMLALKGDIFPGYGEPAFAAALAARARVVRAEPVSSTGRKVFWFER